MSPEAQRIAIAQACGWTNTIHVAGMPRGTDPSGWARYGESSDDPHRRNDVPNYLSDLNAMHEAEKVLTGEQWWDYARRMTVHLTGEPVLYTVRLSMADLAYVLHAPAEQRAEAFLRTLNLWTD